MSNFLVADESEDTVYIWDVYNYDTLMQKSLFYYNHKLVTKEFACHNLADGEWVYGQPYYEDFLSQIGVENPMWALLYREHTYYVDKNDRYQLVLTFLQEHYDSRVVANEVDSAFDFTGWEFSIE